MTGETTPVVMIDGVCNLCNGVVRFILARERQPLLRFTNLQSDTGKQLVKRYQLPATVESVILIEDGRAYTRSDAALRILPYLRFPWPLLQPLVALPRPIRDSIYDWVARNRYRWFGKLEVCPIPGPELRPRFLD